MLHKLGLFKTTDATHQFQLRESGSTEDIIEIFWDDTTETIRAWYYTNQTNYNAGTGEEVFSETPVKFSAIPLATYSSYKFCAGTTLVQFVSSWTFPFFFRENTANSYICSQVVCDLIFQGAPIITPAPSENSTGRVQLVATSSNGPIQYSPGPFTYGYGFPTGDFLLSPGDHTIYAIDEAGCYEFITITIPIQTGIELYGIKYFASYKNLLGDTTRIEILEKGYSGDSAELVTVLEEGGEEKNELASSPFVASWGKNGDLKQEPIKPSEATIKLISYTDYNFLEFYTNETRFYQVRVKRGGEDGEILWWGYVLPELYGEPYIHPPYYVDLVCNDGLGDLKNIPFAIVNQLFETQSPYSGRWTHLQVVVEILKKIDNILPIYTAINTIEENMDYEDVPNILKYTFETDVDEVFPNELEEGVKYIFNIKNNLNIGIYYGSELIYNGAPASTGLVNGDFSDGLNGWSQSQNGFASEEWGWTTTTSPFWDKAALINTSSPKTNYLFQAFNFTAGEEYTLNLSAFRETWAHIDSRYRIKVLIGIPGNGQEVYDSGLLSYLDPQEIEISTTFTPIQTYGFIYLWMEFSMADGAYGQFLLDAVSMEGEPSSTGEATFEYTPSVSHEDITIDVIGGSGTTVEIYESIQDVFNQVYVDTANYSGMNCFDVLQEQLKLYGARMYQAFGAWHIIRFDQQNKEYLRNKYDKDGVFVESEYFNPIRNIKHPSADNKDIWILNNMMLEIKPGYRSQSVIQQLGYVENLITGGDFPLSEFNSDGGLKHFISQSSQGTPPIFYEQVQISENNYGVSFKNSLNNFDVYKAKALLTEIVKFNSYASKGSFPGIGQAKTVYIDEARNEFWLWNTTSNSYVISLYEDERLPSGIGENDFVLVNSSDPEITGLYQVHASEPWTRYVSIYYIGPSFGNFILIGGTYYKIIRTPKSDGDTSPYDMTIQTAGESELTFTKEERDFLQNNPVNIEVEEGDIVLIRIKKKYIQPSKKGVPVYLGFEIKLGNSYLYDDYTFKSFYNHIEIPISDEKDFSDIEIPISITTDQVGDLTVKTWFYYHGLVDFINIDVLTGEVQDTKFTFPNLVLDSIAAIYLPQGSYPPTERTQQLNNSKKFNEIPDAIEVMHGDSPEVLNRDKIYSWYLTLKDGTLTKKWHRKGFFESKNLLKLLLEIILSNNLNNNELITGNIRNLLSLNDVMFDPNNPDRLFMMNFLEWDEMEYTSSIEIVEIKGLPENEEAAFSYGFSLGFKS